MGSAFLLCSLPCQSCQPTTSLTGLVWADPHHSWGGEGAGRGGQLLMDPTVLAFRTTSFVFFVFLVWSLNVSGHVSALVASFTPNEGSLYDGYICPSRTGIDLPCCLSRGLIKMGGVPPTRWTFSQRAHRFHESNIEALTAHDCTDKYSC